MGHTLPQFPHPTRPEYASDPDMHLQFPQQFHPPELLELPERSRPVSFQTEFYDPVPRSPPYSVQFSSESTDDDRCPNPEIFAAEEEGRIRLSPSTGRTPMAEKEAVDELLSILVECMEGLNTRSRELLLRKFFAELEREESLEQFIVERLKQSRVKAISELCEKIDSYNDKDNNLIMSRGTDVDDLIMSREISESVEELSLKLERFKVRTVDVGGTIVKEEEKK
ncbi:Soluble scavenger receptor cysteine-rich domain-containing protein [Actinidia chinensis var. chinensis]|uniref:Soluble scavenger receptor cysteine-rich domain-containing protein n=1 Tax=Actinidia chinensis var. chinensis TaxID=1590841 RepID=A0A2R6R7U1_ACTCC|nr:Soluble scavenger receptor cysteine-rich domain-containing protein [Actinidia chinensis var. chinensis]